MEDLSKHQLILLTLLVSFVTSIATGIITFTLLQEAPIAVTQTINRVVERTIETVVPADNGNKETVREIQVVNEEELVLNSIDKNTKSIVRIKTTAADGSIIVSGLGLIISEKGYVALDSRSYNPNTATYVVSYDGKSFSAEKVHTDSDTGLIFIKLSMNGHSDEKIVFTPVSLGNSDSLKLGQTIIKVSGKVNNSVSIGRVSEFDFAEDLKTVVKIVSDIKSSSPLSGSPLLNTAGEIIGLEATPKESDSTYTFIPINSLKSSINKAISELAK